MSDTPIHEYYPENKPDQASPPLVAGEAPTTPNESSAEPNSEDSVVPVSASNEPSTEITDLGIDLPDIPLPDDDPLEDSVSDTFSDAAFNFAVVGVGQGG